MLDPAHLLQTFPNRLALIWQDQRISYSQFETMVAAKSKWLAENQIVPGTVVGLKGDFSDQSISILLALLSQKFVVAMLPSGRADIDLLCDLVQVDVLIDTSGDEPEIEQRERAGAYHPLVQELFANDEAGFVIFSSGSSGRPKPILHSLNRFLQKYQRANKPFVTLTFLLLDHIAGIDTLFYVLFSGGTLVAPVERGAKSICKLIESAKVEVLPVSPSFLNLLWLSGDFEDHDLSSVKIVTYGSEPMTQQNLDNVQIIFPNASIKQKYGTSEFGSPASKSRGNDQLWIKLEGDQFQTKVVDGILFIKSATTMLGYLDDSEPMFVDGWYNTGDQVEVDGEWIKILGRDSDLINVGGEKVFPSEVEAVIQTVDGVIESSVYGEPNPITGQIVCAMVYLKPDSDPKATKKLIKRACADSLARYKVPVRIKFSDTPLTNLRQKKIRAG